jgi:TatD DNase family protein
VTNPLPGLNEPPPLPALDAHAHLAPDVTPAQVRALGHCHVFAVTRSLEEAAHVQKHPAPSLTWGLGVHPGAASARDTFERQRFTALLPSFALVGEIGMDRRAGHREQQAAILRSILQMCTDQPVLLSVHSAGQSAETLELLAETPHPGTILHWWNTDGPTLDTAIATDAYFSVNAAMSSTMLARIPIDRVLTETDFPARATSSRRPGDTRRIEEELAMVHQMTVTEVRHRVWVNLRRLAVRAAVLDRLGDNLADQLLSM